MSYDSVDQQKLDDLRKDGWSYRNYSSGDGGPSIEIGETYIFVDEDGNDVTGVVSDEPVSLDATANDIRQGKTAATNDGVTLGEKIIPSYHTEEGLAFCSAGDRMKVSLYSDRCQYTKFQALVCTSNTSTQNSVATIMVSIDGQVYAVNSTESLAEVVVDAANQAIDLAVVNDGGSPVIIRYFTYKEIV